MIFLRAKFQDRSFCGGDQFAHLRNRRRVDPVFRIAEAHIVFFHGFPNGFGIAPGAFSHAGARHAPTDGLRVAGHPKIAGQGLFHDDMLASLRRPNGEFMVKGGRNADVDDVDVRSGEQLAEIIRDEGDFRFERELFGALPGARAHAPDGDGPRGQTGIICEMHFRPVAGARESDSECFHGLGIRAGPARGCNREMITRRG